MNREKVIIQTSVIGIIVNLLLAGFKAVIGLASNSIAILLDAVNNLSDALSSVITIVGTWLAGKKPDKKHPLGYGRIEYLSSMVVSAIVLYAGFTALVESVKKIIHPEKAEYSITSLVIVGVAVIIKFALGMYVKKKGKEVKSGSLQASGSEAVFDGFMSLAVLASALISMNFGISLEAYLSVLISVLIVKSGIEMVLESVNEMLGTRPENSLAREIKAIVEEDPMVHGAYDLLLNNYGPDRFVGSIHVEVDDTFTAEEIDSMSRRIADRVYQRIGIILAPLAFIP